MWFLPHHINVRLLSRQEAIATELSFSLAGHKLFLDQSLLLGQHSRSVDQMRRFQVENGVLSADAVFSVVRILVDETLLFEAEIIDHLTHPLCWLWLDDPLGDLS